MIMGEQEYGKCDLCGKESVLARTYFDYPIKCECHSPRHFEMVKHCDDCVPKMPKDIKVKLRGMDGEIREAHITNIVPIDIQGEFIID